MGDISVYRPLANVPAVEPRHSKKCVGTRPKVKWPFGVFLQRTLGTKTHGKARFEFHLTGSAIHLEDKIPMAMTTLPGYWLIQRAATLFREVVPPPSPPPPRGRPGDIYISAL